MDKEICCPYCEYKWFYSICCSETLYDKEVLDIKCKNCSKNFEFSRNYYKVYLSRSLFGADIKYKYVHSVIDKFEGIMLFEDPIYLDSITEKLRTLRGCDICVSCIQSVKSTAPFFEMTYARMLGLPVFTIDYGRQFTTDKWVHSFSDKVFENIEDCYNTIVKFCCVPSKKDIFKNFNLKKGQILSSVIKNNL